MTNSLKPLLLLLPQRYVFSSKSQHLTLLILLLLSCCCYHKGTYFQANHNMMQYLKVKLQVVVATTKVRIFKQITTRANRFFRAYKLLLLPQRYVFSSKSQPILILTILCQVVVATTKVRIFKQITTVNRKQCFVSKLLLLPQRYVFSSKSQLATCICCKTYCCCCYHKGTYFQANHNKR